MCGSSGKRLSEVYGFGIWKLRFQVDWYGGKDVSFQQPLDLGTIFGLVFWFRGYCQTLIIKAVAERLNHGWWVVSCQAWSVCLGPYLMKLLQILKQDPWVCICFHCEVWEG